MRPSRRVLLLSAVAIACGAVIVGPALIALETPEHAVARAESRTLPAIVALDDARARSIEGQQLFFEALASPPDQRNAIIADAQQTGARATTAWHQYQRIAYGSHQELSLQRQFEAGIKAGQLAGAAVFTVVNAPEFPAYDIALAQVRALGSQVISTLDTIEHRFYARRLRGDLLKVRDGLEATRRAVLITFFAVLFLGVLNAAFLLVGALREERLLSLRDEERIDGQRRTDLETQLQRGLEMEPTEGDTYGVVGAALALAQPNSQIELLLAD